MVKLPIYLETRPDWREVVSDALRKQRELEQLALQEEKETGEYLRPIVLFQAQSLKGGTDIGVEDLKKALVADHKVPDDQIAIATGATRGIEGVDLNDRKCPIRFIITVRALVEGWDCPFAYILCSVSEVSTPRSVEQVLGRILRLPHAQRKKREELNRAYAFAASSSFIQTAGNLRDALIEGAGFQRMEAAELVRVASTGELPLFPSGGGPTGISVPLAAAPDLSGLEKNLHQRVSFDPGAKILSIRGMVSAPEGEALQAVGTTKADRQAIQVAVQRLRGERGEQGALRIPLLAVRVSGQLRLLEDSDFLEVQWNLAECDPTILESEYSDDPAKTVTGQIDMNPEGRIEIQYAQELRFQTSFGGMEPGWTVTGLANWLDKKIPHPDILQSQSSLFLHKGLSYLIDERKIAIARLVRDRFRLINAFEKKIDGYRTKKSKETYQAALFGDRASAIEVDPEVSVVIDEADYAPNWYYEGTLRFKNHKFHNIGELKSEGEEFECATVIDRHDAVEAWVRNLERKPHSFRLPTATDKFYPDFVALLKDGRYLVVEYKGEHLWSNDDSREKRAVGDLWAERSKGRCIFVMPKGKDWAAIDAAISKK